jgi:hypothetical protein
VPTAPKQAQKEWNLHIDRAMDEETLRLKEDNFDDQSFLPNRHLILKWGAVMLAVVVLCAGAWELSEIPGNSNSLTYPGARQPSTIAPRSPLALRDSSQFDPSKAIGTSGSASTAAAINTEANAATIRELDSIIGGHTASELVGRHVELQVPVVSQNNLVAFWVGSPDDRLLVVLHRDVRDGHQRQVSDPPEHGIRTVEPGQQATISGTIQRVPDIEGRFSWDLTRQELKDVEARGFYLQADSLRTAGG